MVGDDNKDPISALFVVEDVFLEVADSGVFWREELSFRVVRDPPECVSQIIFCIDRVSELIKSVFDEAEEEFPLLLVLVLVLLVFGVNLSHWLLIRSVTWLRYALRL